MGPAPPPELVRRTIEACRVVLQEVRRSVDSTVTNAAVKAELRRGVRAAESALNTAEQLLTASLHRSGASRRTSASAPTLHVREDTATLSATTVAQLATNAVGSPVLQSSIASRDDNTSREERHLSNSSLRGGGTVSATRPVGTAMDPAGSPQLCTTLQDAVIWSYLLSTFFWKRRKLTKCSITALELLLRVVPVPSEAVTLIVDLAAMGPEGNVGGDGVLEGGPVSRRSSHVRLYVAAGVYYALSECVLQSFSEPAVQIRALRLLSELITRIPGSPRWSGVGAGSAGHEVEANGSIVRSSESVTVDMVTCFRGRIAMRVVESCFKAAAEGMQDSVRCEGRVALHAAVQRVVYNFVKMRMYKGKVSDPDGCAEARAAFSTDTILSDYTVDVDSNEPYTRINFVPSDKAEVRLPTGVLTGTLPIVPAATAATLHVGGQTCSVAATQLQRDEEGGSKSGREPTAAPSPLSVEQLRCSGDENSGVVCVSDAQAPSPMHLVSRETPTLSAQLISEGSCLNEGDSGLLQSPARSQPPGTAAANIATSSLLDVPPSPPPLNLSFDPHKFFPNSVDESLVLDALSTLNAADGALPSSLKDLLMVLRRMCRHASHPCSGTLSDASNDVRARDLGLWVLECVLDGLPVANCEREHRCAKWMSLVLHACKYELLGCIVKNLAMATPFTLFERAVHLLGMLLRKLHYHMARELHTLLGAFLLPLMASQYAGFRQKYVVLSMIKQLFAVPHLCIAFFINYDCSPAFDPGAEYGGMLELLVEYVVKMTFLDHVDENGDVYPWLSFDQQQLLRSECVVVICTLMASLYRWIAEDPREYAESLLCNTQKDAPQRQQQGGGGTIGATESSELYVVNLEADAGVDPHPPLTGDHSATAAANGKEGKEGSDNPGESEFDNRKVALTLSAFSGMTLPHWNKRHNVMYHWKHIHYLLHDKRIFQEAVQRINAGRWREAKEFLESRGLTTALAPSAGERADPTSVVTGTSSYSLFARFLFEYPGISREALSAIFEKVNQKDGASRMLLLEYLHCFDYKDVPIDVALRDTTCKFMSWERPTFEAKVWETIQECFGNEYANQNPHSITARDADAMAGVLLFLHSNLHNVLMKNERMQMSQFVRDANDCLEFPMMVEDLQAIFNRVLQCKWELDTYGRTPQEAGREQTLVRLSTKIKMVRAAQQRRQSTANNNTSITNSKGSTVSRGLSPGGGGGAGAVATAATTSKGSLIVDADPEVLYDVLQGTEENDDNLRHTFFSVPGSTAARMIPKAAAVPSPSASLDGRTLQMWSSDDMALLDNTIPAYAEMKDGLKTKEPQHHAFHEAAAVYLQKLESVHRVYCIEGGVYRPQPYISPYYAEHVRQILLLTYPHVMSCVYMGFRVLKEAPISRKLLDTVQVTYDIAAAFVLNLHDLRPAMEEALQRYLDDKRVYRLLPQSRATFVPFFLNVL
ncbi:Guanine nucleotide exchange factor in Golgi transport Nterminal [Leishmania braziliensis]|nr:Guanine nucleotide exchange factor in Golgi transport Nterminal [Leishmania braziliensis]